LAAGLRPDPLRGSACSPDLLRFQRRGFQEREEIGEGNKRNGSERGWEGDKGNGRGGRRKGEKVLEIWNREGVRNLGREYGGMGMGRA